MKQNTMTPLKVTPDIIEVNLNFRERPVMTSILLCVYKPDMAFIIFMYLGLYLFLFYLVVMKLYLFINTTYISLSPTTHEKINYLYTNFIDYSNYIYNINRYFIDMVLHKIQNY